MDSSTSIQLCGFEEPNVFMVMSSFPNLIKAFQVMALSFSSNLELVDFSINFSYILSNIRLNYSENTLKGVKLIPNKFTFIV